MVIDPSDLTETISVRALAGRSSSTSRIDGPLRTMAARVEDRITKFIDDDGREIVSTTWIGTLGTVEAGALIWTPGKDTSKREDAREPVRIRAANELGGGQRFTEIFL